MKSLSVNDAVREALEVYGFLRLPISMGVVNFSALARQIRPVVEKKLQRKVELGAIIIAVQRQTERIEKASDSRDLLEAIARTKLRIRTNHYLVNLRQSPHVKEELVRFYNKINEHSSERMYVVARTEEITVILGKGLFEKLMSRLQEAGKPIEIIKNRALISLVLTKKARDTPGYLTYFLNELAAYNVNLDLIFTTRNVDTFVISDADASLAYDRLLFLVTTCASGLADLPVLAYDPAQD